MYDLEVLLPIPIHEAIHVEMGLFDLEQPAHIVMMAICLMAMGVIQLEQSNWDMFEARDHRLVLIFAQSDESQAQFLAVTVIRE